MIDDIGIISFVVLEHHDCPIYPYRKLIDKIALLGFQRVLHIKVGNVFRAIFAKHPFLAAHILQQHLWQNEHTVAKQGVVVVAYVVYGHTPLHILQDINALENVFHIGDAILVFFYQDTHS